MSQVTTKGSVAARCRRSGIALLAAGVIAGCGGGGGDSGSSAPPPSGFEPSSTYAAQCVNPRAAGTIDPLSGRAYGDRPGTATTEKNWVRSWIDETYLWYDEVPNLPASSYPDAVSYFDALKTAATTASGQPKDRFHFTYPTAEWASLALAGVSYGYGMQLAIVAAAPPRKVVVAYTDPGTPAVANAIARGAQIVSADGVAVVDGDPDRLNAALFPSTAGTHSFVVKDVGSATTRSVTMTAQQIAGTPVQNVKVIATASGKVGYMLFNDHVATAESELIDAVNQLKAAGPITDLVLDIRYNGGGYLDIASELAYMITGPGPTTGKTFEKETFNRKNPFDFSDADSVTPFHATTQGFSTTSGRALPQLGLARVFVLTGAGTCSASEAIINGLRGVDVPVVQIGATTCGKPYGFFPQDNCSTTYFAIQFEGVNAQGFGDYADGFVPGGTGSNGVTGCAASDDFTKPLGDPAEARLAMALGYRATGTCTAAAKATASAWQADPAEPTLARPIVREIRLLRRPH